jgi:hypothetical protein
MRAERNHTRATSAMSRAKNRKRLESRERMKSGLEATPSATTAVRASPPVIHR